MNQKRPNYHQNRSIFWPVVLIGAGVIWLLTNLNILLLENLWFLFRLWPILIIVAGLDVLFSRKLPLIGALLGLLIIAGVITILLIGENLQLNGAPVVKTETFQSNMGETKLAQFDLNLSIQPATIHRLENSSKLIEAEIGHTGEIDFTVTGGNEKQIKLEPIGLETWFSWVLPEELTTDLIWDIGLSSKVPWDLSIKASTAPVVLDLSGVQLDRLHYAGSTGKSSIVLPVSSDGYEAQMDASTGETRIVLPSNSNVILRLDGSTGQITLDASADAFIQIKVLDGGTGDLIHPERIMKVSGAADRDEGTYETPGFKEAEHQLIILVENLSTGNIIVE